MSDSEHYGPALPPAAVKKEPKVSGPALPPGFVKQEPGSSPTQMDESNTQTAESGTGGDEGTDADGNLIGPMVSEMSHGDEVVQAAEEFERRSRKMKDRLTVKAEAEPGPSKREEWMTELPPEMSKNIGVTARTFTTKGGGAEDKDRSDWTDTPADKIKKEKEGGKSKKRKRDDSEKIAKQRDEQLQQQIEEYNKKKRPDTLVEMHQKSKKKKKKKEEKKKKKKEKKNKKEGKEREEKPSRQAFDREKDLKVNKFDEAQRKAIIKKSAMLNTRFQHSGSTSSFL